MRIRYAVYLWMFPRSCRLTSLDVARSWRPGANICKVQVHTQVLVKICTQNFSWDKERGATINTNRKNSMLQTEGKDIPKCRLEVENPSLAISWCAAAASAAKAIGTPAVLWIHDIMAKLEYCDIQNTQRWVNFAKREVSVRWFLVSNCKSKAWVAAGLESHDLFYCLIRGAVIRHISRSWVLAHWVGFRFKPFDLHRVNGR